MLIPHGLGMGQPLLFDYKSYMQFLFYHNIYKGELLIFKKITIEICTVYMGIQKLYLHSTLSQETLFKNCNLV